MSKGEVAVVPVGEYAVLKHDPAEIREVIEANIGNEGVTDFDLQRVTVPAGGALHWSIERLDGEDSVKTIVGVIIAARTVRAFWSRPLEESGGGTPPDCTSSDGLVGEGTPGGDCRECPYAQWGSDPKGGRGQACKQMRPLFLLEPESLLPIVVVVPPTSLKALRSYMLTLASSALPYYKVVTELGLARERNADGIEYARIVPKLAERLTSEQAAQMKAYAAALQPAVDSYKVSEEDYPVEEASPHPAASEDVEI